MNIPILHVDDAILVIDKPAGLPVLPDGWIAPAREASYLVKMLEAGYGRLWTVHRLDKPTSGVMVFARTAEAHRALSIQFERHEVKKVYHALAEGNPRWDEHTARHPLRANVGHKHRTVVDDRAGKPSVTHFRVLERFGSRYDPRVSTPALPGTCVRGKCAPGASVRAGRASALLDRRNGFTGETDAVCLLEAIPETGRTHQVRVHASALGHPLLGDSTYGSRAAELAGFHPAPLISRPALHAYTLTILHPTSGEPVTFNAPYPEDFALALRYLREENQ